MFVGSAGAAPPRFNGIGLDAQGDAIQGFKSQSAKLAKSDASLLSTRSKKLTNIMVKFDYDGAASYMGGVQGFAPTSPEVTGKSLRRNWAKVNRYVSYLATREAQIVSAIRTKVSAAQILGSYRFAYGGVAVRLPGNRAKDLLSIDGIAAVQRNNLEQVLTDNSPQFIGADDAWAELDGDLTGQGVKVGTIDTGIWPEHPSYVDPGIPAPPGGPFGCEFGDGTDPLLGDAFTCQDKLIGAYANTDTYMALIGALPGEFCNNATGECSARDADGHGTHTSTTSGGDAIASAMLFDVERGPISGIAPGAHVIMYRVCLDLGCFSSDSVAAVEQAILDDVDVINFSISGGANAFTDPVELAFLDAYAAGILVNASAGNSGPGAATANHAGPWVNTIGASTQDRAFESTLSLTATGGDTLDTLGVTVTDGVSSSTPVILAEDVAGYTGTSLCLEEFDPGSVAGYVVACERGTNARVEKGYNVLQGDGEGMILYNTAVTDVETDNHWLSAIHLNIAEGSDFLDFYGSHTGVEATWTAGVASPSTGDVMASFSSRGPLGDFIKPDITAPGVQILAGHTPDPHDANIVVGPPGQFFQAIAGTSMSSPHAAGSSGLVEAGHNTWSPGQVKSALMTSADNDGVVKEDFVTPADPHDMGAGSVRPALGLHPSLTFDVLAADYYAAADDVLGRIHLNLPSIQANPMPGRITTTRTGVNVSGETLSFDVETDSPDLSGITVTPSSFTVDPGDSVTLTIFIHGGQLADNEWYFGEVRLVLADRGGASNQDVHLPVAWFKAQTDVTLTNDCESTDIGVGESTDCSATATNNSATDANVDLKVRSTKPSVASLSGDTHFVGLLEGAAAPTIDGIVAGGSPYGYVPLSEIPGCDVPIPGFTDETLVNIGTPEYLFGGEVYDAVAMTSNGYGLAGEGGAEDLDFVPQDLPDPAAPNNVLAPFWTDLNPADGGALYACVVTDGVDDWIILDWEGVPTFGTGGAETQSFQFWLQLGVEGIFFEYGEVTGDGSPDGLTVGAENRDGTSGAMLGSVPAAGDGYTIETSPGSSGGEVTLNYTATGESAGTAALRAILSSDIANGETVRAVLLSVS